MADDVEHCRAALERCPPGHPDRPFSLHHLAVSLRDRFKQRGVLSDLDESIELNRAALLLRPLGHPDRSLSLNNLAVGLRERFFTQRRVPSDMDESIELNRAALLLRPVGHPDRPFSLHHLAVSLRDRSKQRGVLSDLDESIELNRAALLLLPSGHPLRPQSLNNLAVNLGERFTQRGVPSDLDESIELHQAALLLHPLGHPDRPFSLTSLADSLRDRFKHRGVPSDLDESIELNRAALLLRPLGHSDRSQSLNSLAISVRERFAQRGVPSDLDESIELFRAALLLLPPGHFLRWSSFNNLAVSLHYRFTLHGVPSDLDECIELNRTALLLSPPGHSDRPLSLSNLAFSLGQRFTQRGVPSDLDECIELNRAALLLFPSGHPDRSQSLDNLAVSLRDRFMQRGILSDLDESIELHRAALLLSPPGHSNQSLSLINLALSLQDRFKERGIPSDLDESIELHRAALLLSPPGNFNRSTCLNNLAASLQDRFTDRGIPSDLDECIELHRAALLLSPHGHSNRSTCLNNLAVSLQGRFTERGIPSDLDECIELHRAALLLSPPGHSNRSLSLGNLALTLRDRFTERSVPSDLDETFSLFLQLPHTSHAVSCSDLTVAKSWVTIAEETNHGSALVAYQTALKFLDQHVTLLSSSSRHFDVVRMASASLAVDAFSCSIRHGALTTAVELVEQGRAVFLTQLARLSSPFDELSLLGDTGAALAEDFKQLSFRLRSAFDQSTKDQSPQIRQLTMQWNDVLSRIRMLPNLSRFLLPPLFSDLQKAAEEGPVIIVNASQYSCDALIVLCDQNSVHIPIDITRAEVTELSSDFQSVAEQFGSSDRQNKLVGILRKLWRHIVDPVVQALNKSNVHPGSRIWWCPTAEFTLLPLHAAGPYERERDNLSQIYVSSYTPALATLVRARQRLSQYASTQCFVAIGQGNPDRGKALRCVAPELAAIAQRLAPIVSSFTPLEDSDATVQGVLDALNHNQWLHLACHGMPNRQRPFESSFAMRDGPLMIRDIIRSNWENPEFAFLSACHTTVGDEKSPDESIHLAAAMQFSGFRSVIGSMWSVDDEVARQVVSAFYDKLVDDSGRLDCTRAAVALHKAVKKLRGKNIPLEQQIVFVHIGV
ncbi:TPR-like protein [Suillus subalutaceus]|uniref:TPR-like protein n=1 Tax=Suillus subalutaceus TaxID=48586 RepID=UPI001B87CBB0|nr:TPR-like protein [Suillus subalutaceus]KAG1856957.1 TPR-like protein [Suillus subalutaceus]